MRRMKRVCPRAKPHIMPFTSMQWFERMKKYVEIGTGLYAPLRWAEPRDGAQPKSPWRRFADECPPPEDRAALEVRVMLPEKVDLDRLVKLTPWLTR